MKQKPLRITVEVWNPIEEKWENKKRITVNMMVKELFSLESETKV